MDRMILTIDIQANDIGKKRVNLRSTLIVANLISTIKDKFSLDGDFELRLEKSNAPLPPDMELDQTGAVDGSTLVCAKVAQASGTLEAIRQGVRQKLSKSFRRVYLQDERNLGEYNLAWQPSIIGRKDRRDPAKNRLLAIDLDGLEESLTVSRHHACITEADGSFYIESINPDNPTFLNDQQLTSGVKYSLPAGSRVRVGKLILNFHIIS
jgi:hypothetical protein